MKNRYKVIAVIGKSGSGKSSIIKTLKTLDGEGLFNFLTPCTTRPRRTGEDENEYHFLTEEEYFYKDIIGKTSFVVKTKDNKTATWHYGVEIDLLSKDKVNLGIFNNYAIKDLLNNKDIDVSIVCITAPDKERIMRSLKRENKPNCLEICRRFIAEYEEYKDIQSKFKFDFTIVNSGNIVTNAKNFLNWAKMFYKL